MNKLWRIGNHLSKMGWVPRKISRILELINHLICACSVIYGIFRFNKNYIIAIYPTYRG